MFQDSKCCVRYSNADEVYYHWTRWLCGAQTQSFKHVVDSAADHTPASADMQNLFACLLLNFATTAVRTFTLYRTANREM